MGETWFFRPDTKVTREEFLAMAMDLVDLDALPEGGDHRVCRRGQYLRLGPTLCGLGFPGGNGPGNRHPGRRHHLDPGRTITGTEAAVLLDRLLQVSDVADTGALEEGAAPAWALRVGGEPGGRGGAHPGKMTAV